MSSSAPEHPLLFQYDAALEETLTDLTSLLSDSYRLTRRAVALLLLQEDPEILAMVREVEGERFGAIEERLKAARACTDQPLDVAISLQRHTTVRAVTERVVSHPPQARPSPTEYLGRLCMSPLTGIPILMLVLWFGLYQFVGIFGGGTLVGLLEERLFGEIINPWMTARVESLIPWRWLSDLFVGEYGIWTLGITYAVALVFPIVGTFFLAFSVLEDTGYFPRLAMLIDRLFKRIGLNGKAVIPIVLGFGCDTMATIVTRILETRRERIIATFLLSLAIPCSAQIGLMTALLAGHPRAFMVWVGIMAGIFLIIGWLTAKLLPGEAARFTMEIPPLRLPSLSNIAVKTLARMQWYFLEVLPLFVIASIVIWIGQLTGLFDLVIRMLTPVVHLLGLPDKASEAFLFGFFRRDYGAAGLERIKEQLNVNQLLVSVVTLTIFLPCVAQFLMMKKERGMKMALMMAGFIFPFALIVGIVLNQLLKILPIKL